jgi:predicted dehydrogenase
VRVDKQSRGHQVEADPPPAEAPVGLGFIGDGPLGSAYVSALCQLRDAHLVATCGEAGGPAGGGSAACERPDALLEMPSVTAVVVAGGTDSFSLASRALLAAKHVLVCGPDVTSPRQVRMLQLLAESRSRLLVFAEPRLLSPSVAFLRKMLAEGDGLWLPWYLRSLNVRAPTRYEYASVASLAVEDLALCLYLLNRPALSVSAVGSCSPGVAAAFLNVTFAEGVVAGLQISLAEAHEARQLVVALADKTLLLDESDPRAPLKVVSNRSDLCSEDSQATHGVRDRAYAERGAPSGKVRAAEPILEQCRWFVEAVPLEDLSLGNASFWARVAGLWEAAESSMAEGGVPIAAESQTPRNDEARRPAPRLWLVRSGGIRREATLPKRSLTLVGS